MHWELKNIQTLGAVILGGLRVAQPPEHKLAEQVSPLHPLPGAVK